MVQGSPEAYLMMRHKALVAILEVMINVFSNEMTQALAYFSAEHHAHVGGGGIT